MVTENAPGPAAGPAQDGMRLLRLIGLGALIGIPAALLSIALLAVVHDLTHWLWHDVPHHLGYDDPPWFLVIGLPLVGAVVVLLARMLPGDGGHDPSEGLVMGDTPVNHLPGIALAAIGSLAFGAVLGPEGPLVALGACVGAYVAARFRRGKQDTAVLESAGSFSAISALFGGPLAAGVLLTEASVGLGAAQAAVLIPGFVAAALGYTIFIGVGNWGGVNSFPITIPDLPVYDRVQVGDLFVAVAVGVVGTVLITLIRTAATRFVGSGRRGLSTPVVLLGGAALVGLLAQAAVWLGESSGDVLFSGQAALPDLLGETAVWSVVVLLVAKGVAYLICLSCGFRGGAIFPAIFIGVAVAQFAVIAFDTSPTLAIAIGTATGMAASTKLILASMLMATLLVGTAGIDAVPAAVLASVAAWITTTWLSARLAPPMELSTGVVVD